LLQSISKQRYPAPDKMLGVVARANLFRSPRHDVMVSNSCGGMFLTPLFILLIPAYCAYLLWNAVTVTSTDTKVSWSHSGCTSFGVLEAGTLPILLQGHGEAQASNAKLPMVVPAGSSSPMLHVCRRPESFLEITQLGDLKLPKPSIHVGAVVYAKEEFWTSSNRRRNIRVRIGERGEVQNVSSISNSALIQFDQNSQAKWVKADYIQDLDVQEEYYLRASTSDGDFGYFGTGTQPGSIIKFALFNMSFVKSLYFNPGEDWVKCAVADGSGFGYFGMGSGVVVKVSLVDMQRVSAFDPQVGGLVAAFVDGKGFGYFGSSSGHIVKLFLGGNMALAANLTVGAGHSFQSACTDGSGYGYFATQSTFPDPSTIFKISLADMRIVATLLFSDEQNNIPVLFTDGAGFGYGVTYGRILRPSEVVKFDLRTMITVGIATLSLGDGPVISGFVDDAGFAYLGTDTTPASVVKVSLANLSKVDVVTSSDGQGKFWTGFQREGFGYFGTYRASADIVKVPLGKSFAASSSAAATLSNTKYDSQVLDAQRAHTLLLTVNEKEGEVANSLTDTTPHVSTFGVQPCHHSPECWRYNLAGMHIKSTTTRPLMSFALFGTLGGFAGSLMAVLGVVNGMAQKILPATETKSSEEGSSPEEGKDGADRQGTSFSSITESNQA